MKKYEITKEQIETLSIANHGDTKLKLKEWFPDVFNVQTGYYKHKNGNHKGWICFIDAKAGSYYGINSAGEWMSGSSDMIYYIAQSCEPASESEISELLKKEAVKRCLIPENIKRIKCLCDYGWKEDDRNTEELGEFVYELHCDKLWIIGCSYLDTCIYSKGDWANLTLVTKTKAQAEKELNCKIID